VNTPLLKVVPGTYYVSEKLTASILRMTAITMRACKETQNNPDEQNNAGGIKSGPVTLHSGALGERRYSSCSFLTSALEGGEWSASRPGRALPPGKEPPVPTVQEAGWAPEPVWTQRLEEESSASVGDRIPTVQSDTVLTELHRLSTIKNTRTYYTEQ
jgi:hypothetical protein